VSVPGATPDDVAATLAWLHRDAMVEALCRDVSAACASSPPGVGAERRAARERELLARLLDLERAEEALIEASPEVPRRPDADPRAVLGVEVVAASRHVGGSPLPQRAA
jgi:hypothetical protein